MEYALSLLGPQSTQGAAGQSHFATRHQFDGIPIGTISGENGMAQEPLATKGNFLHIYDFRVTPGKEQEFIRLFEEFDYSDGNPMHKSSAQVKDGVLCRDTEDPQRFFLIAEWADIQEHAKILKVLAAMKPEFIKYIEGKFVPKYVEVVFSTPDEILNRAAE
jgi:hypothetical protein